MTTWYVVAGNIDEHWDFCDVKKQEIAQELADATVETINDVMYERAYVYVESAEMLRSIDKSQLRVWFVGTYRQRPDIDEIETIAKHGIKIIAPVCTKDLTDDLGDNDWTHVAGVIEFTACRTGWYGVWDAIVALFSDKPRLETNQGRTIEYWVSDKKLEVKSNGTPVDVARYINGMLVKNK